MVKLRKDWRCWIEAEPGLNGRSIGYACDKALGSLAFITFMIYIRGQMTDFDHWAQLGNSGWFWALALRTGLESASYGLEDREINWSK